MLLVCVFGDAGVKIIQELTEKGRQRGQEGKRVERGREGGEEGEKKLREIKGKEKEP